MTKNKQLRGQALLDAIEDCLRQLANEKENSVYNASELSRRVGCSRPTLDKKAEFIDEVLKKIGGEKRIKKDHPMMEHLYTRIESLEAEKEKLKKELSVLRAHHAKIYSTMYTNSVDVSVLIKPIVEDESIRHEKCILCSGTVKEDHSFQDNNKVIPLSQFHI
jgi:DNA repair ATPase RecN